MRVDHEVGEDSVAWHTAWAIFNCESAHQQHHARRVTLAFLRIQLHHGSCWRSATYTTQDNCRSAAWMPAKGSKIPASVKHGSPRESSRSEPSDLVQLGRSLVIVTGAQNAGSALGSVAVQGANMRRCVLGVGPNFC